MAITMHYVRNSDGGYDVKKYRDRPMDFAIRCIPDGVPFQIYRGEIGDDTNVTEDFDALKQDDTFHIVETAGGGGGLMKILDPLGVIKFINKLILPSQSTPSSASLSNRQAESPNNSLTDRNNKPRPYERSYDICGTVQTIPNDLMTTYQVFNDEGRIIEYGFYDAGRGDLYMTPEDITDGDTRMLDIEGSSAAVYAPYTSPNSGHAPQVLVGDPINQGLYITVASNDVDGEILTAPNKMRSPVGEIALASLNGTIGTINAQTTDAGFSDYINVGDYVIFEAILVGSVGADLSGGYVATYVSSSEIRVDANNQKLSEWQKVGSTPRAVTPDAHALIGPYDTIAAGWTNWSYINRIKVERILVNVAAPNGMYKDDGDSKTSAEGIIEVEYQPTDKSGNPITSSMKVLGVVSGRSSDYTGVSIYGNLPSPSYVRVRCRRTNNSDLGFGGTVSDDVTYVNLYGQSIDTTPHYGNRTTVHSARKQTPRASSVKQPQLRITVTEMVNKYLGSGIFATEKTPNTQAVQSLIRLARDPVCGNLDMSVSSMDKLLAVQSEIETYFGDIRAGQFCYTFDDMNTTMQEIISTIAEAVFCTAYRRGPDILLDFERPRSGPEMVFTHRSKTTASEKWSRTFNDHTTFDSLEFSYIDPDTNVKEIIRIPEEGGSNTETYTSKGIRNYQQAYWAAHRRHQKNILKKVTVSFTATEEGVLAIPNRPISVVKGSRMAPQDGYVIAVNGLRLTLSQPVQFVDGDDHSLILKKRNGGVQSVPVIPGSHDREVIMTSVPSEAIYAGNSALKTEFSFGNEQRHNAQMILVTKVDPADDRTVQIAGFNYDADFYKYDSATVEASAFSTGFSSGFF